MRLKVLTGDRKPPKTHERDRIHPHYRVPGELNDHEIFGSIKCASFDFGDLISVHEEFAELGRLCREQRDKMAK